MKQISTNQVENTLIRQKKRKLTDEEIKAKMITTRDVKLKEREKIDQKKVDAIKSLTMKNALPKDFGRKDK